MQKYIIIDNSFPIIFDCRLQHKDVASNLNVTSAGFLDREGNCSGGSDSLGIDSNPVNDSKIINLFLRLTFKFQK